jgi:choline dehydrogenase-like flavoprotein
METFSNLGLISTMDPRTGKALGAFQNPATIDPARKSRSSAVSAYLGPEVRKRPNLVVLTDTTVARILTTSQGDEDDVVATGVMIMTPQGEREISCRLEVILAAGALQSPQILELSGIGGRELLEKHDIPIVIDNPNVGEHLQDHAMVPQSFEVNDNIPSADVARDPNVLDAILQLYNTTSEGPLGQSTMSAAYTPLADENGVLSVEAKKSLLDKFITPPQPTPTNTVNSSGNGYNPKELQIIRSLIENPSEPAVQYILCAFQMYVPDVPVSFADLTTPVWPENYMTIMTLLSHQFSRGYVHIVSPDVRTKPEWDPKFNTHPLDLEMLAGNVRFVDRILSTEPFRSVLKPGGQRHPAAGVDITGDGLERARDVVRRAQTSLYHVCGSCAMLPRDQGGVVNARLLVYGTRNLRVVDASIFPLQVTGNIMSTVYAVAERAADFIKEDRVLSQA